MNLTIVWSKVHPRIIPRRLIFAAPFNNKFDMTQIRLHELGDVVDLFMFGESNCSSHGDPKPQLLLKALNRGFMREFQHKILYVLLDHFDPNKCSPHDHTLPRFLVVFLDWNMTEIKSNC